MAKNRMSFEFGLHIYLAIGLAACLCGTFTGHKPLQFVAGLILGSVLIPALIGGSVAIVIWLAGWTVKTKLPIEDSNPLDTKQVEENEY